MIDSIEHDPGSSINASNTPSKIADRYPNFIPARSERKPPVTAPAPMEFQIFLLTEIHKSTIKGAEKTSPHREATFVLLPKPKLKAGEKGKNEGTLP
jgi:hypothetical protein